MSVRAVLGEQKWSMVFPLVYHSDKYRIHKYSHMTSVPFVVHDEFKQFFLVFDSQFFSVLHRRNPCPFILVDCCADLRTRASSMGQVDGVRRVTDLQRLHVSKFCKTRTKSCNRIPSTRSFSLRTVLTIAERDTEFAETLSLMNYFAVATSATRA